MNIKFRRNLKLIEDEFGKSQTSLVLNLHHQIIFACSNTSWTTDCADEETKIGLVIVWRLWGASKVKTYWEPGWLHFAVPALDIFKNIISPNP